MSFANKSFDPRRRKNHSGRTLQNQGSQRDPLFSQRTQSAKHLEASLNKIGDIELDIPEEKSSKELIRIPFDKEERRKYSAKKSEYKRMVWEANGFEEFKQIKEQVREKIEALKAHYNNRGTIDGLEDSEGQSINGAIDSETKEALETYEEISTENSHMKKVEDLDVSEPRLRQLDNGEKIDESYAQKDIDEFNRLYDQATANGASVPTHVWNFQSYLNEESIVGNYTVNLIQNLPKAPKGYKKPGTFILSGVKLTYDTARQYADCGGNCYSTSVSRINDAYEKLYGITPIDYTRNPDGTFTSADYRTASSQSGAFNFGYGVGGALANGGEANLVDDAGVWAGNLKPGAALQIWHTIDEENITEFGGHSQIFLNYTYDKRGIINGMKVFDNSGVVERIARKFYENQEIIRGGNLLDP